MKNKTFINHKLLRDSLLSIEIFRSYSKRLKEDWEEVLSASENYTPSDNEIVLKDLYWGISVNSKSMVEIMKNVVTTIMEDIPSEYTEKTLIDFVKCALKYFPSQMNEFENLTYFDYIHNGKITIISDGNIAKDDTKLISRIIKNTELTSEKFTVHNEPYYAFTESDFETAIDLVTTTGYTVPAFTCVWLNENTLYVYEDEKKDILFYQEKRSLYGTYGVDYM